MPPACSANAAHEPQSKRAQLYEILADLTDDDAGAVVNAGSGTVVNYTTATPAT